MNSFNVYRFYVLTALGSAAFIVMPFIGPFSFNGSWADEQLVYDCACKLSMPLVEINFHINDIHFDTIATKGQLIIINKIKMCFLFIWGGWLIVSVVDFVAVLVCSPLLIVVHYTCTYICISFSPLSLHHNHLHVAHF